MGVRCLNKFINKNCKKSILNSSFDSLYGKRLAIDANIYMYKFTEDNDLIERFYLMISLFKFYNIKPIFVFDGGIDIDKIDTIKKRRYDKYVAEERYNELLEYEDPNSKNMVVLKKKFTRVSKFMFNEVKKLIELMGETYIEAPCEADEVCGWLAITNQVHGCLSEDTDLFVYGCPRVYKNLDLNNFTLSKYEYNIILKQMNISSDNFTQLCVIANNDYNNNSKNLYYFR
jgi:5'-3' exonuclease